MTTTRTHFTFRVDTWTPNGESIVEHVAGVEDYPVAPRRLPTLAGHADHLAARVRESSRTAGVCAWPRALAHVPRPWRSGRCRWSAPGLGIRPACETVSCWRGSKSTPPAPGLHP